MTEKAEISTYTRVMLTISVMLATVMQVLDSTIANVALPHMQGTFGATQDQTTWVLTSYILSSAIVMTLTGFLTEHYGRKRIFIISIVGFTISSMLCGIANSLEMMVIYRFLQGIFGAAFIPLSQATLLDVYPKEKHGSALALWGMGIMVGPILGPIIGGYLTDTYDWRWVFYINVPLGIATFFGISFFISETTLNKAKSFDWKGFSLLSSSLTALQIGLDRGEQLDWFNSLETKIEFIAAIVCFYLFMVHTFTVKNPFISLKLFKDKNFSICLLIGFVVGINLQSTLSLMPTLLQDLMNYPVLTAGYLMAPRGIGTMIAMIIVGRLISKIDARIFIIFGLLIMSYAMQMMANSSPLMDSYIIINSGIIFGLGMGFIFVPSTSLAFATLDSSYRTEAAGIYSLVRNIGGSIGISYMASFVTSNTQMNRALLTENLNPYNKNLVLSSLDFSNNISNAQWNNIITAQANFWGYINSFKILMWFALVTILLIIFLKKNNKTSQMNEVIE